MTADRWAILEGDCRAVLAGIDPATVSLVLTDPPYGVQLQTEYRARKRGALARCNDFPRIVGDEAPFDPSHLLRFPRLVLFGANYYAERLPASPSWLIWDKLAGLTSKRPLGFNDQADVELAWTNLGGPARLIPHRWMGCMKGSEHQQRRIHPTQKPVALMAAIVTHFTEPGDLIIDPYAGSGSVGVACIQTGRRFLGIEIIPEYVAVARTRIGAVQPALAEAV